MRGDRETRNENIKQVGGRRADRVRRRSVIARLAALLTAPERPSAQQSQGKIPRVGILTAEESERAPKLDAFRAGLRDLGYIEGRNIIVEFRFARGDLSRGAELAAELVSLPVDVIVIEGVPAAYDPNGHISIVSPVLMDPGSADSPSASRIRAVILPASRSCMPSSMASASIFCAVHFRI